MANLLSLKQKRAVKVDYRLRFYTLFFFMLIIAGIFAVFYILPFYNRVAWLGELVGLNLSVADSMVKSEMLKADTDTIKASKQKQSILASANLATSPDVYINKILDKRTSNILIQSFDYRRAESGANLAIVGNAKTRDSYNSFILALKAEPMFASVDYPVSAFAEVTDIAFKITIKLKNGKEFQQMERLQLVLLRVV